MRGPQSLLRYITTEVLTQKFLLDCKIICVIVILFLWETAHIHIKGHHSVSTRIHAHTYIQVQDTGIPTNTIHNHIHIISQHIHTQHTHFPFPISPVGVHAVIRLHPSFSPIAHHPSSIVSPIPTASLALVMFALSMTSSLVSMTSSLVSMTSSLVSMTRPPAAWWGMRCTGRTPGQRPSPPNVTGDPCHGPTLCRRQQGVSVSPAESGVR